MKNVWLRVACLLVGWLEKSCQFGVKFEEGAYRRVSVHISGVDEPENCGNFLAKFEVIFYEKYCELSLKTLGVESVVCSRKLDGHIFVLHNPHVWYKLCHLFDVGKPDLEHFNDTPRSICLQPCYNLGSGKHSQSFPYFKYLLISNDCFSFI